MKNLKLTNCLSVALILCALTQSLTAQNMALTGKIRSPQDAPVPDAEVSIYGNPGKTLLDQCFTDAQGKFTSDRVLRKGQHIQVEVAATGYTTFKKNYTVNTGNTGKIVLTPLAQSPGRPSGSTSNAKEYKIGGIVRSDAVTLLKDVIIDFTIQGEDSPVDNDITDEKGIYLSNRGFKRGDRITVVAHKTGFSEETKVVEIQGDRDLVVDFVLKTRTYLAGFVLDGKTSQPVPGVQLSFQSRGGPFIDAIKTNGNGYFDFDVPAPFLPGDPITVHTEKPGYKPEDQVHIITIAENRLNFVIKKWTDVGVDLGIRVYGRKGKPMRGAEIIYVDDTTRNVFTPENGVVMLNVKKGPGDPVQFQVLKPGYRELIRDHTLRKELQYIDLKLEKDQSVCPCWLYATLGLAAATGTGYTMYSIAHKDYKQLDNPNWEDDYKKSNTWLKVGTIAGGLTLGALTGWIICLNKEAKKNRETERRRNRIGFIPWSPSDNDNRGVQLGIAYPFYTSK